MADALGDFHPLPGGAGLILLLSIYAGFFLASRQEQAYPAACLKAPQKGCHLRREAISFPPIYVRCRRVSTLHKYTMIRSESVHSRVFMAVFKLYPLPSACINPPRLMSHFQGYTN